MTTHRSKPLPVTRRRRGHAHPRDNPSLPEVINTDAELDEVLTRPRPVLVEFIRSVSSPLVILGAGGKMGPTLAALAQRAAKQAGHALKVIAVSRFSDAAAKHWLEQQGVKTVSADLLERKQVERLPDSTNIIYLVGQKFGTKQNPAATWAVNIVAPAHAAERYKGSRIVALSTGNVYPLVEVKRGGADEERALTPLGEYANAAVARERLFEHFSRKQGTPVALLRLSYATELRYGVLADIARKVHGGVAIDVTSGHFNCIWQGDANEMILRSLPLAGSPPLAINLTSPDIYPVRGLATQFAKLLGRPARFVGAESGSAFLSNTNRMRTALGRPPTDLEAVIRWTAHWVRSGGRSLNKPTRFETRDGAY
ncbi:MAG: NAD(P)-dependent oxidoreductase [Verrucomicrobia bacterium]|nr:NAD(P)-dependent oxidoreductase [Verrucomicrobiota bacterium]